MDKNKIKVTRLNAWFSNKLAVKNINMEIVENKVTAIIGPSGCGKSTFIRCLNRMHEVVSGASATGEVWLDGENIFDPQIDPVLVRRKVGMVFQKATPFPTMSIYDNVAAGLKLNGKGNRQ